MRFPCPHCQVMIEIVEPPPGSDVQCPQCGSRISSELAATIITPPPSGVALTPVGPSQDSVAGQVENGPRKTRPQPIEIFGRFQLLRNLGSGSYGEVFWAYDPSLDREVALKRPHARRMSAEDLERFLREARAAAQLKHPNIVGVYEVNEVDDRPYIASEYIRGIDLAELIAREKAAKRLLSVRQVAQLCGQVSDALHAAHEAGIVHRDLKPANIVVGEDGLPRVMDFGMAKRESTAEFVMTREGQPLGSPAYMSPEQWEDSASVGRATDIWSLGVMLFELLTGEFPFRAALVRLKEQVLTVDPPPPSQLNSQVPKDLDTLCLKCLEKDSKHRFQTAADLADELHRFLNGEPIHSRPITQWERAKKWCQRNPVIATLSAAVALSLLIGTVVSGIFAFLASRAAQEATRLAAEELAARTETESKLSQTKVILANSRWNAGRVAEANELLDGVSPQHRHLEWSLSREHFEGSYLTRHRGTDDGEGSMVVFSPDGRHFASTGGRAFGEISIWDSWTGDEVRKLRGLAAPVHKVFFSRDGTQLVSVAGTRPDGGLGFSQISICDVENGTIVRSWSQNDSASDDAPPNGPLLNTQILIEHFQQFDSVVIPDFFYVADPWLPSFISRSPIPLSFWFVDFRRLATSDDGTRFAELRDGRTIVISSGENGAELRTLTDPLIQDERTAFCVMSFSHDGQRLAVGTLNGEIQIWDLRFGQRVLRQRSHSSAVLSLAFSPEDQRIVSCSYYGEIKLWNIRSEDDTWRTRGSGSVDDRFNHQLAFSPDECFLAVGRNKLLTVYDAGLNAVVSNLKNFDNSNFSAISISPDGKSIAAGDYQGAVHVFEFPQLRNVARVAGLTKPMFQVGDDPLALIGERDRVASLNKPVLQLAYSSNSQQLAITTLLVRDRPTTAELRIVDISSNKTVREFRLPRIPHETAFADGGHDIVAFFPDGTRRVWSVESGEEVKVDHSLNEIQTAYKAALRLPERAVGLGGSGIGMPGIVHAKSRSMIFPFRGVTKYEGLVDATVSRDGRRIAGLHYTNDGRVGTLSVWDVANGLDLVSINESPAFAGSLMTSPSGRSLAWIQYDDHAGIGPKIIGRSLHHQRLCLQNYSGQVADVVFSPDSRRLISSSQDGSISVWNAESGASIRTIRADSGNEGRLDVSRDGRWLISAASGKVVVTDFESGQTVSTMHMERENPAVRHGPEVAGACFNFDATRVYSSGRGHEIKLWYARTGKPVSEMHGHRFPVRQLRLNPDGKVLASLAWPKFADHEMPDSEIKLWNSSTFEDFLTIKQDREWVTSICFSPNGDRFATGSFHQEANKETPRAAVTGILRIRSAGDGRELLKIQGVSSGMFCVAFSHDGRLVAAGDRDGAIRIWDSTTGEQMREFDGHTDRVTGLSFSPDGRWLASGSWDGTVRLWDLFAHSEIAFPSGENIRATHARIEPDGQTVWCLTDKGETVSWNRNRRSLQLEKKAEDFFRVTEALPPQHHWFAAIIDHRLQLIDQGTLDEQRRRRFEGNARPDFLWHWKRAESLEAFHEAGNRMVKRNEEHSRNDSSPWYAITFHRTWLLLADPSTRTRFFDSSFLELHENIPSGEGTQAPGYGFPMDRPPPESDTRSSDETRSRDQEAELWEQSGLWQQLIDAAKKTLAEGLPLPSATVKLFRDRGLPLPRLDVDTEEQLPPGLPRPTKL